MHDAALDNLAAMTGPELVIGLTPGGSEAWLKDDADNFNAARLLLPGLQRALQADLGPSFFVCIPCRDWFVCWSRDQAAEWQTKNKREAMQIFRSDDYNLSPDVLAFVAGKYVLAETQDPSAA